MRVLALCFITLFLVLPAFAQEDVPPPSGEIAFTQQNEDGIYQIYLVNADGTNIRQITDNETNTYLPIWSPDGQKIAFMRELEKEEEREYRQAVLAVMDADGGNIVEIARDEENDIIPNPAEWMSWSPSGDYIVYRRYKSPDDPLETIVTRTDGKESLDHTETLENSSQLYFLTDETLVVTDYESTGENVLLYSLAEETLTPLSETGIPVKPSPDGTQLALVDGQALVIIDIATGERRVVQETLTGLLPNEEAQLVYALYWSADGSRLVGMMQANIRFDREATPPPTIGPARELLFAASTDGTEYAVFEAADRVFTVSPDGDYIAYSVQHETGGYQLAVARADGEGTPMFPLAGEGHTQPAWRPVP